MSKSNCFIPKSPIIGRGKILQTGKLSNSVRPRLIAERLLLQPGGSPPVEHKMLVFDGRVRVVHPVDVARDRTRYGAVYDCDWNRLDWQMFSNVRYEYQIPRPEKLNDLVALGEQLGAGFDFIRVDTYDWAGGIRIGEMTVYHLSGPVRFKPDEADFLLGSYRASRYHQLCPLDPPSRRTVQSKGCLSNKTALAMVFKLAEAAEKSWRRLDGHSQLQKIILGVEFTDGIEVVRSQAQIAAA